MENLVPFGDPGSSWYKFQIELIENLKKLDKNKFLKWNVIRRTMFCVPPNIEYKVVSHSNLVLDYPFLLNENKVGAPPLYLKNTKSSGNLVHHLYSIVQFINFVGWFNFREIESVVEFGGGYGSLARIFLKLGKMKRYTIFDLPLFNSLQKFFLTKVCEEENIKFVEKDSQINITSTDSKPIAIKLESEYKESLKHADLFVALWSMSESPLEVRKNFEENISSCKYTLIAFQKQFDNVNNVDYFYNLLKEYGIRRFNICEIKHLPGNFYLFIDNSRSILNNS